MSELGILAPWVEQARKISALFEEDSDIECSWDDDERTLTITVSNAQKLIAARTLLPEVYNYGKVDMYVDVIGREVELDEIELFKTLFDGNLAVYDIKEIPLETGGQATFIIFEPEVVQYYNDNLESPYGLTSTLYENIAADVFENASAGIFFTTDKISSVW